MAETDVVGDWRTLQEIGAGNQGKVFKAVRRGIRDSASDAVGELNGLFRELSAQMHDLPAREVALARFLEVMKSQIGPRPRHDLVALKRFHPIDGGSEGKKAIGRLKLEIEALEAFRGTPGLIRLIEADINVPFIVTEYHPNGTLHHALERYKGDGLAAMRALRPVVEAAAALHGRGVIHRDIKPANILLSEDSDLVLGDLGVVFFQDGDHTRLTGTFEKVGSAIWIPQWALSGYRLEDAKPNLDVYALGKVLWCMAAGRPSLHLWYWDRKGNSLEDLNPRDPASVWVNRVLRDTVVEEPENCLADASEMLKLMDYAIAQAEGHGLADPRHCLVCRRGEYRLAFKSKADRILVVPASEDVHTPEINSLIDALTGERVLNCRVYACKACGHVQLFHGRSEELPEAWRYDIAGPTLVKSHPAGG